MTDSKIKTRPIRWIKSRDKWYADIGLGIDFEIWKWLDGEYHSSVANWHYEKHKTVEDAKEYLQNLFDDCIAFVLLPEDEVVHSRISGEVDGYKWEAFKEKTLMGFGVTYYRVQAPDGEEICFDRSDYQPKDCIEKCKEIIELHEKEKT